MTSWANLEDFITSLSNSLYNGAYIDMFRFTKNIISGALRDNKAVYQTISAVSDEATAKAFVEKAREYFLNFQLPSTEYNSWSKNDGAGKPITTWTNPEDIVLIIRNDVRSKIDVQSLASAFNLSYADFMGRVITVDNFDVYDDDGTKVYDGSSIVGGIFDKSWFRIKTQDMFMENFYNPNNRTMQYFLNVIRMYNFSLFANGVVFVTSAPSVATTKIDYVETAPEVTAGEKITLHIKTTPFQANDTITFTSGTVAKATVTKIDNRTVEVTGVAAGTSVITASNGASTPVTATVTVTVNAAE